MARKEDRYADILTVEVGEISFFTTPLDVGLTDDRKEAGGLCAVLSTPGRGIWRLVGLDGPPFVSLHGARDRAEGRVLVVTPHAAKIAAALGDGGGDGPKAQAVGAGRYAIVRHEDTHTHFVYALDLPTSDGPILEELGIPRRSTFLLVVKNPQRTKSDDGAAAPAFHPWILERFEGRRFMEATPPEVLDFVGAEIALVTTADDVTSQLGLDELVVDDAPAAAHAVFDGLQLAREGRTLKPLIHGAWEAAAI